MKKQHQAIIAIISSVLALTGKYFEQFSKISLWQEKTNEIHYANENINALSGQQKFLLGLLLVIVGASVCVDYASIHEFLDGLVANTGGGVISFLLKIGGVFFFVGFESFAGVLLKSAKKEHRTYLIIIAYILGVLISIIPAYLVWQTYVITPDDNKTIWLYNKTITLTILSATIHIIMLLAISRVIDAAQWLWYGIRIWWNNLQNPVHKMKGLRKLLINEVSNFDRNFNACANENEQKIATANMTNRSWYLRQKLNDGNPTDDYDLSYYNEHIDYSPFLISGNYRTIPTNEKVAEEDRNQFGSNSKYTYTVS